MTTFYAYIDISNPMVAWETAIGRICAARLLEEQNVFALSIRHFSLIKMLVEKQEQFKIKKEFEIEKQRLKFFPEKVSRLRGIYFFESIEHAKSIVGKEGWRSPRFKERYLSKVKLANGRVSRFDSEWITSEFMSQDSSWIKSYLDGETYGISPTTEIIADGLGKILNEDLKREAFSIIKKKFSGSIPILLLAQIAFKNGFNHAGQIVPFLRSSANGTKGCHILNMRDFENDSEFTKLLNIGSINKPAEPENWNGTCQTPDLRSMDFNWNLPIDIS